MNIITFTVRPRSKREIVEEIGPTQFIVYVKSTPERGRSTKDALKLLARHLRLPFSKLMLSSNEGLQEKTAVIVD